MSEITQIYNFLQINDKLATGGQATVEQFSALAESAYELVINLAPSDAKYALVNEGEIVQQNGMSYIHIPVIWDNPTEENWQDFVAAMDANAEKKIFIHCIANMRVSAFVMLYRHIKLGLSLEEAQAPMLKIWNPAQGHPTWQNFVNSLIG